MKTFVSYSFIDSELYLITLLFEQLRTSGYEVETSSPKYPLPYSDNQEILCSDVFIGIITNNSESVNHVIQEWNIARQNNIQNILIIENGVRVDNPNTLQFIRFDRRNPQIAINQLFNINTASNQNQGANALGGVLLAGGLVVGVAALLALLSGDKK